MLTEKFYKRYKYMIVLLVLSFLWNSLSYWGGRLINQGLTHHDLSLPVDLVIPLVPVTVILYFGAFLFWFINYSLIAGGDDEKRGRFFMADFISRVICLAFFIILPTTLVRPEPGTDTAWSTFLTFVYQMDSADNLFPSIHCLASWLAWVGVRNRKDIPAWYRNLSLVLAILICISTVTTKQHVVVDIFAGVILAELCYWLVGFFKLGDRYLKFADRVAGLLGVTRE